MFRYLISLCRLFWSLMAHYSALQKGAIVLDLVEWEIVPYRFVVDFHAERIQDGSDGSNEKAEPVLLSRTKPDWGA